MAAWIYGNPPYGQPQACMRVYRTLRLVGLAEGGATLLDSHEPAGQLVTNVTTGSDRIWIERSRYVQDLAGGRQELDIETITGIRAGRFQSASKLTMTGGRVIPQRNGVRFVVDALNYAPPRLSVFDTADPTQPQKILELGANDSTSGYGYYGSGGDISLDPQYLIQSLGKYGATATPLP